MTDLFNTINLHNITFTTENLHLAGLKLIEDYIANISSV